ncbi:MAG: FliM/FliN family flagellar motor switch protein [Bdellovibrionota bacterium]
MSLAQILLVEKLLANLLSDVFSSGLNVICINPMKAWVATQECFYLESKSKQAFALDFSAKQNSKLPFDWLLARFAHLLAKNPEKYQQLKIHEKLILAESHGYECLVYGAEDLKQELVRVVIAATNLEDFQENSLQSNWQIHPLEKGLPVKLELSMKIAANLNSLNLGTVCPVNATETRLRIGKEKFRTNLIVKSKTLILSKMEEEMEQATIKTQELENFQLEIMLGTISISLEKFLKLRSGSMLEFEMPEKLEVRLTFAGEPWGRGLMNFEEQVINLEIIQIGENLYPQEETFLKNERLLNRS